MYNSVFVIFLVLSLNGFTQLETENISKKNQYTRPTLALNYYASANQYLYVNRFRIESDNGQDYDFKNDKAKVIYSGDFRRLNIYGIGFYAKTKKDHRITRFNISYMPKQIIEYSSVKGDTEIFDYDSTIQQNKSLPFTIDLEAYTMSMNILYRITKKDKPVFFYMGYGFSMSFINSYNRKYNHFGVIIYPTAGISVKIIDLLSIYTEYRYLYGITTGFNEHYRYTSCSWYFYPRGSELEFGLNFHIKNKKQNK